MKLIARVLPIVAMFALAACGGDSAEDTLKTCNDGCDDQCDGQAAPTAEAIAQCKQLCTAINQAADQSGCTSELSDFYDCYKGLNLCADDVDDSSCDDENDKLETCVDDYCADHASECSSN